MSAFEKVSGPPAVRFANLGDGVAGRIVSVTDYQETEFGSNPPIPKTYPKTGDPIMAVKIILETKPGDETTQVTLYAQGKLLMAAIAKAFRVAGRSDVTVGDDLAVTFTGFEGRAKKYEAAYDKAPEAEAAA